MRYHCCCKEYAWYYDHYYHCEYDENHLLFGRRGRDCGILISMSTLIAAVCRSHELQEFADSLWLRSSEGINVFRGWPAFARQAQLTPCMACDGCLIFRVVKSKKKTVPWTASSGRDCLMPPRSWCYK